MSIIIPDSWVTIYDLPFDNSLGSKITIFERFQSEIVLVKIVPLDSKSPKFQKVGTAYQELISYPTGLNFPVWDSQLHQYGRYVGFGVNLIEFTSINYYLSIKFLQYVNNLQVTVCVGSEPTSPSTQSNPQLQPQSFNVSANNPLLTSQGGNILIL